VTALTAEDVTVGDKRTMASFSWSLNPAPSAAEVSSRVSRHVPEFRSTVVGARGNQARHSFGNFRCDVT